MNLLDYPRPAGDTGIGFHWFPDYRHYEQRYFDTFVPELKAMGTSWLVLLSEGLTPIADWFLRGLIQQDIEPIIRIYTPFVTFIDQAGLRRVCRHYAALGVHYVHVFNEPNLKIEWADLWTNKHEDEVKAEGVSIKDYDMLFVDRGEIIHATRDFKPISFHDVLEKHVGKEEASKVDIDPRVGGWGKFAKQNFPAKKREKVKRRRRVLRVSV